MNLPDRFIQNMKELLKEDYPAWRDSLLCVPNTGIRVNELKISKEDFRALWEKCGGGELHDIPWIHNGFFTETTSEVSGHPLYQTGLYYIQEPSAMTPAENLPITRGDYVLDLCAAPGGKSTELLSKLDGTGVLYSNDISASRAAALRKNLELAGAANAFVTAEAPEKLAACFKGFFDKILVDAPCSGEGMFRREPGMTSYWEEKDPSYYAEIQKNILSCAVTMLKPGGCLMYSTCTFSVTENEANVLALIDRCPEMELADIPMKDGFARGVLPGSEKCVRIYPHKMRGEGQFLALLTKKDTSLREPERGSGADPRGQNSGVQGRSVFEKNGEIYLVPRGIAPYPSLRYLLTGLHLGTVKKGRFEPSQALAETLRSDEWGRVLNLAFDDPRTDKYLRGETIFAEKEEIMETEPRAERILLGADPASFLDAEESAGRGRYADKGRGGKRRGHDDSERPNRSRQKLKAGNRKTDGFGGFAAKEILVAIEGYPVGFGTFDNGRVKNKRSPGRRIL